MKNLCVITGGTKGIGKAIVEKVAEQGFDIATCARDAQALKSLKSTIEAKHEDVTVHVKAADVSVKSDVKAFIDFIDGLGLSVELMVNNAGIFIPGQVHQEEDGILERLIATNLYSAYHMVRGLVDHMKSKKSGHIFNICSTASIMPYINGGSYCISKFALLGMSKVLREEMKAHGVRVTSVMPGATLTASWAGSELPPERFMRPTDVAQAIWAAYSLSENSVLEELIIRPQLGDL